MVTKCYDEVFILVEKPNKNQITNFWYEMLESLLVYSRRFAKLIYMHTVWWALKRTNWTEPNRTKPNKYIKCMEIDWYIGKQANGSIQMNEDNKSCSATEFLSRTKYFSNNDWEICTVAGWQLVTIHRFYLHIFTQLLSDPALTCCSFFGGCGPSLRVCV